MKLVILRHKQGNGSVWHSATICGSGRTAVEDYLDQSKKFAETIKADAPELVVHQELDFRDSGGDDPVKARRLKALEAILRLDCATGARPYAVTLESLTAMAFELGYKYGSMGK